MEIQDPGALARARALFGKASFLSHLGVRLVDVGPGWAETALSVGPQHGQADGFVHAGVQATMADHTAGAAAGTLVRADQAVLTVEFKVSLLRPGVGESLSCRAEVVRAGKTLVFCEARVMAHQGTGQKLVATFSSTLAVVGVPGV